LGASRNFFLSNTKKAKDETRKTHAKQSIAHIPEITHRHNFNNYDDDYDNKLQKTKIEVRESYPS
jgi:hypothetical protein